MEQPDAATAVKELHRDLKRKYHLHGPKLETLWRSFGKGLRTKAMKAGAAEGSLLKHRNDASLGVVCKLVPEWNLRDVTDPDSDFLLDLIRYRATTTLLEQYSANHPLNSTGGDYGHIMDMIHTRNLRHVDESRMRNGFTVFLDEDDQYGKCYKIPPGVDRSEALGGLGAAFRAGLAVPQSTGEFVLMRQDCLLQSLNIIIEDILELGSTTRTQKKKNAPEKDSDAAIAAMARLSVQTRPTNLSLPVLLDAANDQRRSLVEQLNLLHTEPVVLAHAVNIAFFTRPELVADEKGRRLPVHTDRYISAATVEAVNGAVMAAATWSYICRLLQILQSSADKTHRAIILQEISNACHLEYNRTQYLLKRYVQSGSGAKYYKRVSNVYDKGHARVVMKIKPEELTRADPQLHYLMRLCQADTNPTKAVEWMEKLGKLQTAHSEEREKLVGREFEALCDHAVIIAFMQDLAPGISMPPLSRKKGQLFVSRSQELEAELIEIQDQIDLTDYVVPIDNLTEPGSAYRALEALDNAISSKMGSKLGFLYEDLIDGCLADLEKQYQQFKEKSEHQNKGKDQFVPFPAETPQPPEQRVEQRRQKEKTRPAHSSVFEITAPIEQESSEAQGEEPVPLAQKFNVKASTAQVFSTLFAKAEARGTVSWASFEAAMADLGFSVIPKFGSVYTFVPPDSMDAKKLLTVHRPHKSHIEGWLLPVFARRMKRLYGWDQDTFETK